jgi:uncharacterized protein YdiU (UPF0061 family)
MNRAAPAGESDALPTFESRFTAELPGDPDASNERRQVLGAAFSRVRPTPVAAPRTLAWSRDVAARLGLPEAFCASQDFAEVMAGNRLLPGMDPYAMCYGGHQFGNWAGQLGDGRAINLGELVNGAGERWTLQLKGAGPTPYSRMADGRAVLRSSLREFLCSEAMHHLGVPTTRALSLVATGEPVLRDMFYDGNAAEEPGAVVCRVAPSFLRLGTFELPASRGDRDLLQALVDYCLRVDFPELGGEGQGRILAWFAEVCRRTMHLMVHWQRVGFTHGVMNTDNLSVLGLTIDYGPYGWIDDYDPDWTPNTTDAHGRRYRFGQQPQVALWNLVQFGRALTVLVDDAAALQQALEDAAKVFEAEFGAMMAAKLGLGAFDGDGDRALFSELDALLRREETDMTLFHRHLADVDPGALPDDPATPPSDGAIAPLLPAWYAPAGPSAGTRAALGTFLRRWADRLARDGEGSSDDARAARRARMNRVNPRYVLRNYLAQQAIDAIQERDDPSLLHRLMRVLERPYDDQPDEADLAGRRPDWARNRAGCSMLSCSS